MSIFAYVKDKYAHINGVQFSLEVFHTLHKNFKLDDEVRSVIYDGQKTVFNDGINQWGGPVPWEDGEKIILRFDDLLMMKKHLEESQSLL